MSKRSKIFISKGYILVAAGLMILVGGSILLLALNKSLPERVELNEEKVKTEAAPNITNKVTPAGYTIIDFSQPVPGEEEAYEIYLKKANPTHTQEQIDEENKEYREQKMARNLGLNATQAASYATNYLKKFYGVDLTGYRVETHYLRNALPNLDFWWFTIYKQREGKNNNLTYYIKIDTMKGSLLAMSSARDNSDKDLSTNLSDPSWRKAAVAHAKRLIPEQVSIIDSKVLYGNATLGIVVLIKLSNGSDSVIRVAGAKREAAAYQSFPSGYDGSWEQPIADGDSPPCCKITEKR
ncbi:hypothetical protein J2Z69_001153 [Paenibacillus shirakamiensis]|uniref:FTP domain-containing protein n=1 Tax=Paenibacillus shirakamiensis TaxID=1265935 RepID=A0ABS4JEJ5_9BACL|nr:hypothetical protein [Paenibacillus shirakamiensis]MBP2000134.1 hypothetical protein [Paenibacillus shirakamiensis]